MTNGQKHTIILMFLNWIFDKIINALPKKKHATILDLGTGRLILILSKKFQDAKFIAIDFSQGMIKQAKKETKHLNTEFIIDRMHNINLKDNSVDYVVSNFAIHHCRAKEKMFKNIYRVLKPKGKIIFGDIFGHFDKKTIQEVNKLRKKYPKQAKAFDKSITDTYNSLSEQEKKDHPIEFHHPPEKFKQLLKQAGFKKIKIHYSLNKEINVIEATK